jgi:hypothetical protein
MKRILLLVAFALMLLSPFSASAQTVTLEGSHIQDMSENALASGQICFVPVNNNGSPIWFRAGGGGQVPPVQKCVAVTSGAFSLPIADTALTYPTNVCFYTTVIPGPTGTAPYVLTPCLQPSATITASNNFWCSSTGGGTCNLDNYEPQYPAGTVSVSPPLTVAGTNTLAAGSAASVNLNGYAFTFNIPAGQAGATGAAGAPGAPTTFLGAYSSGTTYAQGQAVSYASGGCTSTYVSLINSNTGNNPVTATSDWGLSSQCVVGPPVTFMGAYSSGTTYTQGQAVSYVNSGLTSTYVSLVNSNTGNNPVTATSDWGLLAQGATASPAGSNGNIQANCTGSFCAATYINVSAALTDANGNMIATGAAPSGGFPLPTGFNNNIAIGPGALAALGGSGHGTATVGSIAIGLSALANALTVNGTVAIGDGAAAAYPGNGTGGEDGNFVAIGPFALNSATSVTEGVAIGNKACEDATTVTQTDCIGTHVFTGPGSTISNSTLFAPGSGLSIAGVLFNMAGNTIVGQAILNPAAVSLANPGAGNYNSSNMEIFGNFNCAQCYNTSNDVVIGSSSFKGGATAISGTNDIAIGTNIFNAVTSGTSDICIGGASTSGNTTCAALTSGGEDVAVGPGALAAISTGSNASAYGNFAAAADTVTIDAFGAKAGLANTTGAQNADFGYESCQAVTTGGNNTCIGNQAGINLVAVSDNTVVGQNSGLAETSGQNSYFGSQTGRRITSASLGTNEAFGYHEFEGTGNGSETDDAFFGDSGNCTGCTDSNAFGHAANVGGVASATQIGDGTNNAAHTLQFRSVNVLDDSANATFKTVSVTSVPTIASAATIAPTTGLVKVSGTTAISTITPPTVLQGGTAFLGCVHIVPTGLWTFATGGNIALASTAVVSRVYTVCYDGTSWYPSY